MMINSEWKMKCPERNKKKQDATNEYHSFPHPTHQHNLLGHHNGMLNECIRRSLHIWIDLWNHIYDAQKAVLQNNHEIPFYFCVH